MNDIKFIRENPGIFDAKLQVRGCVPMADKILELDGDLRGIITNIQQLQARRNEIVSDIAIRRRNKEDTSELEEQTTIIKSEIEKLRENETQIGFTLDSILASQPNMVADETPTGKDDSENVEVRRDGTPRSFDFVPKSHYDLGEDLGLMNFKAAAKLSGSRFSLLKGDLARLEWALATFMLDNNTQEFGYTQMYVPQLVNREILYGTGQLPKFEEDLFVTKDERWLIPTAEVPLTNMVAGEVVDASELPLRMCAYTQCFRAEAGSSGRDTRGMIRNHQFSKVELVSIVHPKDEMAELERMTSCAETVLKKLGLPYRVITLCSGDIGFSARKTYDLEVWLPSENKYREISSCSTCGQFQARRMNAKFKDGNQKDYVVTLNGSGVAVGRALVAIMENYQNADGSITVPPALVGYMNGKTIIRR